MFILFCFVLVMYSQTSSSSVLPRARYKHHKLISLAALPWETAKDDYYDPGYEYRKKSYDDPDQDDQLAQQLNRLYANSLPSQEKPVKIPNVNKFTSMPGHLHTQFDKLFDKNGMLYLSKPKSSGHRKINKLMNKVINYQLDTRDHKYLRKPLTSVFSADEIKRLKTIVKAIAQDSSVTPVQTAEQASSISPVTPRISYEFSELVAKK